MTGQFPQKDPPHVHHPIPKSERLPARQALSTVSLTIMPWSTAELRQRLISSSLCIQACEIGPIHPRNHRAGPYLVSCALACGVEVIDGGWLFGTGMGLQGGFLFLRCRASRNAGGQVRSLRSLLASCISAPDAQSNAVHCSQARSDKHLFSHGFLRRLFDGILEGGRRGWLV